MSPPAFVCIDICIIVLSLKAMSRYLLFLVVVSLLGSHRLVAQEGDLLLLKRYCTKAATGNQHTRDSTHKTMALPTRILFSFYRNVLSEQISADCAFDLSCSRFSIKAIKSYGILKGGLLTTDRLTRCHNLVSEETLPLYFNNTSGKVIDEPYMY